MNNGVILSGMLVMLATLCGGCSESEPVKQADTAKPKSQAVAAGEPVELQPVPEGWPLKLSVSQGSAFDLFETPNASQKYLKLPPDSGAKRYYDQFTIAGKKHLVVVDAGTPPRLWFDVNGNGDLTDDRGPFPGESSNIVPNHYAIQIRYDKEKVEVPYRFWIFGSNMGGQRFYPVCHWRGTLTVKDRAYTMVAFDGNADGDYSNDPLVIDVNDNGKAEPEEKLLPGQGVDIDGQRVTLISISPSGLTVRLQR